MGEELFNEISAQLIESSPWPNYENGTVGAIRFLTERKLLNMKGSLDREVIVGEIADAKDAEKSILEYLGLTKPKIWWADFSLDFPLLKDKIQVQTSFYENLLRLYLLRNPSVNTDSTTDWVDSRKTFRATFWADRDTGKIYIKNIVLSSIESPE